MIRSFGSSPTSAVMDIPNATMTLMRIQPSARPAQTPRDFPTEIPSAQKPSPTGQPTTARIGTLENPSAQGPSIYDVRKISGFFDPLPPVRIWDCSSVLNSHNLPYYIFFWQWPNETVICPFVRRRMFGAQKCPNIRFRTNVRLRPNIRYFTEYSAILTNI